MSLCGASVLFFYIPIGRHGSMGGEERIAIADVNAAVQELSPFTFLCGIREGGA